MRGRRWELGRGETEQKKLVDSIAEHLGTGTHPEVVWSRDFLDKLIFELDAKPKVSGKDEPNGCFLKVYRHKTGQHAFDAMTVLWEAGFRPPSKFAVARPITYVAEQRLLLQGKAPGRTLASLLLTNHQEAERASATAAEWLVALHGTTVNAPSRVGRVRKAVIRFGDELAESLPAWRDRLERMVAHALASLDVGQLGSLVPSHGDFHPKNMFITDEGRLTVIDLDTFGLQERAADVAGFIAQMAIRGHLRLGDMAATAVPRRRFQHTYVEIGSALSEPRLALYVGLALIQSLHYELCVLRTDQSSSLVDIWLTNAERCMLAGEVKLDSDPPPTLVPIRGKRPEQSAPPKPHNEGEAIIETRQATDALRAYKIDSPDSVSRIHSGRANRSYLVTGGEGRYVLRRSNLDRSPAAVTFEHQVLRYLVDRGFPAPSPVPSSMGTTTVEDGGFLWALSSFISGEKLLMGHTPHLVAAARALAYYHKLIRAFPAGPQREGFESTTEWLTRAPRDSEMAEEPAVAEARRFVASRLPELTDSLKNLPRFPRIVIHGDWRRSHMLFSGDQLTGVLDFDASHREVRGADLATAIFALCRYDDRVRISMRRAGTFLAAYQAEEPLDEEELRTIPPLLRARRLRSLEKRSQRISRRLRESEDGLPQRKLMKLEREMARVEWLEKHDEELLEALVTPSGLEGHPR